MRVEILFIFVSLFCCLTHARTQKAASNVDESDIDVSTSESCICESTEKPHKKTSTSTPSEKENSPPPSPPSSVVEATRKEVHIHNEGGDHKTHNKFNSAPVVADMKIDISNSGGRHEDFNEFRRLRR